MSEASLVVVSDAVDDITFNLLSLYNIKRLIHTSNCGKALCLGTQFGVLQLFLRPIIMHTVL